MELILRNELQKPSFGLRNLLLSDLLRVTRPILAKSEM